MKMIASIHDFILNFYAFIILTVDRRDEELTLLLDSEESNHFTVFNLE